MINENCSCSRFFPPLSLLIQHFVSSGVKYLRWKNEKATIYALGIMCFTNVQHTTQFTISVA